jgi:hypothetical protein
MHQSTWGNRPEQKALKRGGRNAALFMERDYGAPLAAALVDSKRYFLYSATCNTQLGAQPTLEHFFKLPGLRGVLRLLAAESKEH